MKSYPLIGLIFHTFAFICLFFVIHLWLPESWFKKMWVVALYTCLGSLTSICISFYFDFNSFLKFPQHIPLNQTNPTPTPIQNPVSTPESEETHELKKAISDLKKLIPQGCNLLRVCGNEDGSNKLYQFQTLSLDWDQDTSSFLDQQYFLKDDEFRHWNNQGDMYFGGVGFNEMDKSGSIWPIGDPPSTAFDKGNYRTIEIKIENLQYYLFELRNRVMGIKPQPPEAMKTNKVKCQ